MNEDKAESNVTMLVEGYPRMGFKAFSSMISDDTSSLCISRLHPEYVMEKFGLTGPRFYWLTGNKADRAISPKTLSPILKTIKQECRDKKLLVFLDGLEYMLLWNDMRKVLSALETIGKVLDVNGGAIYVSIDPLTFEQKDLDRIWALFPRVQVAEAIKAQAQQISATGPGTEGRTISGPTAPKGLTVSP
jgi:hypothetical protein